MENFKMEILNIIKNVDMENFIIKMGIVIMDIGKMIKNGKKEI